MNTLHGVLTRAGTFPVRDEELTGFVVETPVANLAAVPRLPMYQPVVLVEQAEWDAALAVKPARENLPRDRLRVGRVLANPRLVMIVRTTPKTFGREVRQSRLYLNETLPTVAKRAGLSKGHLSAIENGRGNPSLKTILALCRALYVSPADLL